MQLCCKIPYVCLISADRLSVSVKEPAKGSSALGMWLQNCGLWILYILTSASSARHSGSGGVCAAVAMRLERRGASWCVLLSDICAAISVKSFKFLQRIYTSATAVLWKGTNRLRIVQKLVWVTWQTESTAAAADCWLHEWRWDYFSFDLQLNLKPWSSNPESSESPTQNTV